MVEIMVKIIVEILFILAIATNEVKQSKTSKLTLQRKAIPLGLPNFRNLSEEAGWEDRYLGRFTEAGQTDRG
jgi:hypothetical protein